MVILRPRPENRGRSISNLLFDRNAFRLASYKGALVRLAGFWILFCFILPSAFAESPKILQLQFLEDKGRSLTVDQALSRTDWKPIELQETKFGYSASRFWLRFRVQEEIASDQALFVEVMDPYLERAEFFVLDDGEVRSVHLSGKGVPTSQKKLVDFSFGRPVFRIGLPRSKQLEYVVSGYSDFPISFPLQVSYGTDYGARQGTRSFNLGLLFGILLFAFGFNVFLAVSLKSKLYLYYCLFVVSISWLFLGHENLSILWFWPEFTWWAVREMHVSGGLTIIFYSLFVREFLETKQTMPWLEKLMFFFVAISSIRVVWLLMTPNQWVSIMGELAILANGILILVMAVVGFSRKVRSASIFLVSSLAYNVSVVIYLLHALHIVVISDWVEYAPHLGVAIEVAALSLALADRVRWTNRELRESNRRLGSEIESRQMAEASAEQQRLALIHHEKMAALGKLAAWTAHEINNPLAIIQGNATLLKSMPLAEHPKGKTVLDLAATIEQTSLRISRIIKSMRNFARDSKNDPMDIVPISSLIQDAVALCQSKFQKSNIDFQLPKLTDDQFVICRSADICQVFINLLTNAYDALEGKENQWVRIEVKEREEFFEFAVVDSGEGVPEEIRDRVQDPFFTTKIAGKGTGLGLSISRMILDAHHGKLFLDESSEHTRFVFTLRKATSPDATG